MCVQTYRCSIRLAGIEGPIVVWQTDLPQTTVAQVSSSKGKLSILTNLNALQWLWRCPIHIVCITQAWPLQNWVKLLQDGKSTLKTLEFYKEALSSPPSLEEGPATNMITPLNLVKGLYMFSKHKDALNLLHNVQLAALHLSCMFVGTACKDNRLVNRIASFNAENYHRWNRCLCRPYQICRRSGTHSWILSIHRDTLKQIHSRDTEDFLNAEEAAFL